MPSKRERDSRSVESHAEELAPETLRLIVEAIASLRFGAVEITVHDGRVVQLDKRERFRVHS